MANHLLVVGVISWFSLLAHGDVVLQSLGQCGSNLQQLNERILEIDELDVYSHSGHEYYAPNMDCIITIIGRLNYQWEITLTKINIDKDKDNCITSRSPCCNDYLKIFNSYRVDNARLFPSIPWQGLCGIELPRQTTYTSTQNYITIQFAANQVYDYMTGFALHLRQYPRRSSGTEISQNSYIGGWNDGYLRELQIDWSAQEQVPGDYQPGQDPSYDQDPNGVTCYDCQGCKRDYFKTTDIGVTTKPGCFVCTKEWLQGNSLATRSCLSRTLYNEKLRTLRDTTGSDSATDFRACKTFLRGVQGSTYTNLCVCDTPKCNKGHNMRFSWLTFLSVTIVTALLSVR